MKKLLVLVFAFLLLGFVVVAASAAPLTEDGVDLALTDLAWSPSPVYSSDTVVFTATVENQGTVAFTQTVMLRVAFQTVGESPQTEGTPVEVEVAAADLLPAVPFEVRGELVAPLAGDYTLVAEIDSGDVVTETDEENNERSVPFTVKSVLPPALTQLFAALGVFAAVMAIMAVGVEVVIDSLKLALGLKQKITAMEALDALHAELPGQLSALGVDAATMQQVEGMFDKLDLALDPVTTVADKIAQLRDGHFGAVVDALLKIKKIDEKQEEKLAQLKEQAKLGIHEGLALLKQKLPLAQNLVDSVEVRLVLWIDNVTPQSAAQVLEQVFAELRKMLQDGGPQMTADWLRTQVDTLLGQGRSKVMEHLDRDIVGTLKGLGFSEAALQAFRVKVEGTLDATEAKTRAASNTYTTALQNLLHAVAERRNKTQSWARKLFRNLRDRERNVLGRVLRAVEWLFNKVTGRDDYRGEVAPEVTAQIDGIKPTTAAQVLLEQEDRHRDEERSRQRVLRVVSILVGIVLAYVLNIDAIDLLRGALPDVALPNLTLISGAKLHALWSLLSEEVHLTAGILLTGLAASAGSKFWHDFLGRLQTTKEQAEKAAVMVRKVKGMVGGEEE